MVNKIDTSPCNAVVLRIRDGSNRSYLFTIMTTDEEGNEVPFDISEYTLEIFVKKGPWEKVKPLITKVITQESDENTVGRIYEPELGKFSLTVLYDDYKHLQPQDYFLVLFLVQGEERTDITGRSNFPGVFRIIKQ